MTRQDDFKQRHPDWQHKSVPFSHAQAERLRSRWCAVAESQNGMDVDETDPGGMTSFLYSLQSHLDMRPGSMLVVGCGTGEELSEARALGWDPVGITLGPMNVAWAAEHGVPGMRFEDFHFSTLPSGSFDLIVGRQVWEHSWAPFFFAIECARLLRAGGKLALETPNCKDFIYNSSTVHHVFCPTPFQGARLLEKAGFLDVTALDNSSGVMRPFSQADEHRDDVGGCHVVFVGRRWAEPDADKVNPMVREMTLGGPLQHVMERRSFEEALCR